MEIHCRYCKRYLFTAKGTTIVEKMPCSNSKCRAKLNIKVINSSSSAIDLKYKFQNQEELPKDKK